MTALPPSFLNRAKHLIIRKKMEQEKHVLLGWVTRRNGDREITFLPINDVSKKCDRWIGKQLLVHLNNPECIPWNQRLNGYLYTLEIGELPEHELDAVFGTLAHSPLKTFTKAQRIQEQV